MLQMSQLTKTFATNTIKTHALRGFDLFIDEGEFVSVTGPSGSGKTTFLNIAGLLDTFTDGDYQLDGKSVKALSDSQRTKLRNEKIGFIFQSFNLIPDLDLFDNIDLPLRYRNLSKSERKARIDKALEQVGLQKRHNHLPSQLSGGQQQRVAIARALAGEPRFLLADEPTGNLDSTMAEDVMNLLQDINQSGTTIVMVTHDPKLALQTDRQIYMRDGQVLPSAEAVDLAVVNG